MSVHVLHVDDDSHMRSIVEISLGLDPAFMVVSCASAAIALAKLADQIPALILCDVRMPDMDGPSLLARLRESATTARIPVIFLTANARPRELEQLKALGSVAIITKPFEPTTLAATVRDRLQSLYEEELKAQQSTRDARPA